MHVHVCVRARACVCVCVCVHVCVCTFMWLNIVLHTSMFLLRIFRDIISSRAQGLLNVVYVNSITYVHTYMVYTMQQVFGLC